MFQGIIIPEPQHPDSMLLKFGCALSIMSCDFRVGVLTAIKFDGDSLLNTIEIKDVSINDVLAAKFEFPKLAISQDRPDSLFYVCWNLPHLARISEEAALVCPRDRHRIRPSP